MPSQNNKAIKSPCFFQNAQSYLFPVAELHSTLNEFMKVRTPASTAALKEE
jgi:hypothetical protein